ncbi:M14 family zinc carboxypeptidase [Streptomyces marincola]|uniref:M14 family zinc carboxypeptidase n=1 Tax=Streptomyces marincola TaxID=2878388 RepID=UPI00131BD253|nr:M14 family zinc carboxypeptidase [Streptomyces marincola]
MSLKSSMGYPSVDTLGRIARGLVRRHPRAMRLRTAGRSRGGDPLLLLTVGHGARNVLLVAGLHANEPAGGATSLRLARTSATGATGAGGTTGTGGRVADARGLCDLSRASGISCCFSTRTAPG